MTQSAPKSDVGLLWWVIGVPRQWRSGFEYESHSFIRHGADAVVCWAHNVPKLEEIIDLSEVMRDIQEGREVVGHQKKPTKLSTYQQFCQLKRLEGVPLAKAARMWREQKNDRD